MHAQIKVFKAMQPEVVEINSATHKAWQEPQRNIVTDIDSGLAAGSVRPGTG